MEEEKQSSQGEMPTKKWQWLVNIHSVLTLALALAVAALVWMNCALTREVDKDAGRITAARQEAWWAARETAEARSALRRERLGLIRRAVPWAAARKEADFWSERGVLVTKSGEKYHTYGCSALREDTELTVLDVQTAAERGYTPCSLCVGAEEAD